MKSKTMHAIQNQQHDVLTTFTNTYKTKTQICTAFKYANTYKSICANYQPQSKHSHCETICCETIRSLTQITI